LSKVGAAVRGWAPDTYHAERHPAGETVLSNVQAQSLLMDWEGTRDPDVTATREIFTAMTQLPQAQNHLADLVSGMANHYPMPERESHPLIGRPAPDADLGSVRVHELIRSGRGVLLDPAATLASVADLWSDRVDRAGQGAGTEPMLIRPDGYVCWASNPGGRADGTANLEPALRYWFGEPAVRSC
jgi:hypothetical protein